MVACKYCAKKGKACKMSSLSKKCGNCEYNGIQKCEPVDLPVPDFTKIDNEMSRLEQMEDEAAEAEEAAMAALQAARAKLNRVRKQKKFLKRREQQWFDASAQFVEDIEQLEQQEAVLDDVTVLENGLMPGSLALDWSTYPPPLDPDAVDTGATTVGSS
jgi:DNA repair exonuclease SbcCD ATPase subunit